MKAEMGQRGCPFPGKNGEKWPKTAQNEIFSHFWPFFTIWACSEATHWSHLYFYWIRCYHWVLFQWILWRVSYFGPLPPHFPTICVKIEFLAIFVHFSLFVPTYGWPLYHISTFIDKSVITGCCCNNIYRERATQGYLSPHVPTICLKMKFFGHFWPFFIMCACFLPFSLLRICLYWQKGFHWVLLQWYL